MVKEKIINLIPSKNLRDYMIKNPDAIGMHYYIAIVADLSISLCEKKKLLQEIRDEWVECAVKEIPRLNKEEPVPFSDSYYNTYYAETGKELVKAIDFLETAMSELENFDRREGVLILNHIDNFYDIEYPTDYDSCNPRKCVSSDPVLSFKNALDIINDNVYHEPLDEEENGVVLTFSPEDIADDNEKLSDDESIDVSTNYYELELYKIEYNKLKFKYMFTLNASGEVIYVSVNSEDMNWSSIAISNWFGGGYSQHLPAPYQVGDILLVNGSPFLFPNFVVVYKLDKSMGRDYFISYILNPHAEILYLKRDGSIERNTLGYGRYCDDKDYGTYYMNPVLCAEKYDGELPKEFAALKEISELLKANPELGDKFYDIIYDEPTPEKIIEYLKSR